MTEPVAYLVNGVAFNDIDRAKFYSDVLKYHKKIDIDVESLVPIPLYTSEQLHPRVKMTQAEFDEWKCLYENTIELSLTAYRVLNEILNSTHNSSGKYIELSKRVYQENDSMTISKKQAELTDLFINYSPDNPGETIEIIPNMKWFVRSNKQYQPDMDQGISESGYLYLTQGNIYSIEYYETTSFKDDAQQFDTKEEAEKWTNPLTEAVQLPVEENLK